jgi:hypothetical protein
MSTPEIQSELIKHLKKEVEKLTNLLELANLRITRQENELQAGSAGSESCEGSISRRLLRSS